jgi:hypothetical protein
VREAGALHSPTHMCKTKRRDFFFWHWGLNSGTMLAKQLLLTLEPLCQSFVVMGFFEIGSQELFLWGWIRSAILSS